MEGDFVGAARPRYRITLPLLKLAIHTLPDASTLIEYPPGVGPSEAKPLSGDRGVPGDVLCDPVKALMPLPIQFATHRFPVPSIAIACG